MGKVRPFAYGDPNNPIMWAITISMKASESNWHVGDFSKIVKQIQQEAFDAGYSTHKQEAKV